ncbi:MAG: endonuclease III [Candidatus Omnitrophica bacterium CG1_02_44_16]|nr:MAG: endonuclease III [Candidatus Omnitrophica bacterium CG1_02_44_16]PIY82301.1 MAG: endonuclease III [Candidatus Omnitrophica bacterium CG_4_10_14_0_8_um_filter_44_12]PIZ84595.1 MAG: endonuclease III [Candidatus Omnitrophica bacterium CG_4_10_14_0_2_um_filter_44_9]
MMPGIDIILNLLKNKYPDPVISLKAKNSLELLVATILSAQCTDTRVNIVTNTLFKKYRKAKDYARADLKSLEQDIRSTGFYHNKAKNIAGAADKISKDFRGRVPETMDDLLELPGVARKTANVVLYNAYNKNEGIAVDTHVARVSQRLGLTKNSVPEKIEQDLMSQLDKKEWGAFSLRLIAHGRDVCHAQKPKCSECFLKGFCSYYG